MNELYYRIKKKIPEEYSKEVESSENRLEIQLGQFSLSKASFLFFCNIISICMIIIMVCILDSTAVMLMLLMAISILFFCIFEIKKIIKKKTYIRVNTRNLFVIDGVSYFADLRDSKPVVIPVSKIKGFYYSTSEDRNYSVHFYLHAEVENNEDIYLTEICTFDQIEFVIEKLDNFLGIQSQNIRP